MTDTNPTHGTFTGAQRLLFGGWRNIFDDVRELGKVLAAMPDTCGRGANGTAVRASCCCCDPSGSEDSRSCDECNARMWKCRDLIDTLLVHTTRFFPTFMLTLSNRYPAETKAAAAAVQQEVYALGQTFECCAVPSAANSGCRSSHFPNLRAAVQMLQAHAEQLERLL